MTGLDLFAWIVLIVVTVSTAGVLCIAGWLPGHIASRRNHPWAEAVKVAGWVTLLSGFVLWTVAFIRAYVNVPRREQGQRVEFALKFLPGRIVTGRVEAVLQAIASGQAQVSGQAASTRPAQAGPFVVRAALDDATLAASLPAGSAGIAAIFTDRVTAGHVIRRVLLRQQAILNYVLPI